MILTAALPTCRLWTQAPSSLCRTTCPAGEHCASVASASSEQIAFEEEVLRLTNAARAVGHNCDANGNFGPTSPLTMEPHLRCSARLHSEWMSETGTFSHDQPGANSAQRMTAAGYNWMYAAENIAAGQQTPASVVAEWLKSDGHCANIMSPNYTELGVGFAPVR